IRILHVKEPSRSTIPRTMELRVDRGRLNRGHANQRHWMITRLCSKVLQSVIRNQVPLTNKRSWSVVAVGDAAGQIRPGPAAGVGAGVRMPRLVLLIEQPLQDRVLG